MYKNCINMFRHVPVAVQNCINMFRHVPVAVQERYICVQTRPCCCSKIVLICSDTSLLMYKNDINVFRHVPVAVQKPY